MIVCPFNQAFTTRWTVGVAVNFCGHVPNVHKIKILPGNVEQTEKCFGRGWILTELIPGEIAGKVQYGILPGFVANPTAQGFKGVVVVVEPGDNQMGDLQMPVA